MGFSKRYINKFKILQHYRENGISGVELYLSADILQIGDDWSNEIYDYLTKNKTDKAIKMILSELDTNG